MAHAIGCSGDLCVTRIVKDGCALQIVTIPFQESTCVAGKVRCAPARVLIVVSVVLEVLHQAGSTEQISVGGSSAPGRILSDQIPTIIHVVSDCGSADFTADLPVQTVVLEGVGCPAFGGGEEPVLRIVSISRTVYAGSHVAFEVV